MALWIQRVERNRTRPRLWELNVKDHRRQGWRSDGVCQRSEPEPVQRFDFRQVLVLQQGIVASVFYTGAQGLRLTVARAGIVGRSDSHLCLAPRWRS